MITRALLLDLNNFGGYPTLAVGILTSVLRQNGVDVSVLSPLSLGIAGLVREPRPRASDWLGDRLRYASAHHPLPIVRTLRARLAARRNPLGPQALAALLADLDARLDAGCDVVLISTYLMYFDACEQIVERCAQREIPVLIGGSYLNQPEVVAEWLAVPGVTAIVGGEPEPFLADLVEAAAQGDAIEDYPGVSTPDTRARDAAPPLKDLDAVPFPDYSDFPWHAYPERITPLLTGRGCGWGVCSFCSDVTSSMGRTFRSRTLANVLDEIRHQSARNDSRSFVFTDLKVNSNLPLWRGLIDGFPQASPEAARWIAAVHVNARGETGLSRAELTAARRAGLVRLTTGLESGSQRVLDAMSKGTELESFAAFLHDAAHAGISVRTTLVLGYPGERAEDVRQTAEFLERHEALIERVTPNRFVLMTGTVVQRRAAQHGVELEGLEADHRLAVVHHADRLARDRSYRRQIYRVLDVSRRINRRPLREDAQRFAGVM